MRSTPLSSATALQETTVESSGQQLEQVPAQAQVPRILEIFWGIFLFSLVLLPLLFGGAHDTVSAITFLMLSVVTLATVIYHRECMKDFTSLSSLQGGTFALLCLTLVLAALVTYVRSTLFDAHPDGGTISLLVDPKGARGILLTFSSFILAFFLAYSIVSAGRRWRGRLRATIFWGGAGIALVGLMHWFSDNGKLFWVFSPDNIFTSHRARWPFVNPNHLGAFLLIPLFVIGVGVYEKLQGLLLEIESSLRKATRRPWVALLNDVAVAGRARTLVFRAMVFIIVLLALLATQSRGAWLGAIVGTLVSAGLISSLRGPLWNQKVHRSRRRELPTNEAEMALQLFRRMRGAAQVLFALLVLGGAVTLLSGGGHEVIESRIDFGVRHTKDDMRLRLVQDSIPLITSSPAFGVGLGAWDEAYQTVRDPSLANYSIGYLHSDPIQLLIEIGVIGALPMLLLCGLVCLKSVLGLRREGSYARGRISWRLGGFAALVGVVFASLFDFPFRMHSITIWVAVLLAITSFEASRADREH